MNDIPKAKTVKKRRISPAWITPILALVITIWIITSGYMSSGVKIRVQFDSGNGLIIGKTPLKYRGIDIGKVVDFEVASSLDKINVVIELIKEAKDIAREGMKFWVVKPRLSLDKVSGLETLVSGSYIEVELPTYDIDKTLQLKEQYSFVGLPTPPTYNKPDDSITVNLASNENFSLSAGMNVYFNGTEAGKISSVEYSNSDKHYSIEAFINKSYKQYLNNSTKFWNIGGLNLQYDTAGLKIETNPIIGMLHGGIAFNSEVTSSTSEPVTSFSLYPHFEDTLMGEEDITLSMNDTYGMRARRTPIIYKGIKIGAVNTISLDKNGSIKSTVRLKKEYSGFAREHSKFVLRKPEMSIKGAKNLSSILTGVYIELIKGEGEIKNHFKLVSEDIISTPEDAKNILFSAEKAGSINSGAGIYFKDVQVGIVKERILRDKGVLFRGAIYNKYSNLLSQGLYAWESQPVNIEYNENGVQVETTSVEQLIGGGINIGFFERRGKSLKEGAELTLYPNERLATDSYSMTKGVKRLKLFTSDSSELKRGAPIYYRGVKIGSLGDKVLNRDNDTVEVSLKIRPEYKNLLNDNSFFSKISTISTSLNNMQLEVDVAPVKNIITGGIELLRYESSLPKNIRKKLFNSKSEALSSIKIALSDIKIRLYAKNLNIPSKGTDVYYKGVKAGEVYEVGFDSKREESFADVLIYPNMKKTYTDSTRFWIGGMIDISADASGVTIKSEPAAAYLKGRIHYDSFEKPIGTDRIYENKNQAERPDFTSIKIFAKNTQGLVSGSPLIYKGQKAGYVDYATEDGVVVLVFEQFAKYLRRGALFWVEDVKISINGVKNASSILVGPKIFMTAGDGEAANQFTMEEKPASPFLMMEGLRVTLNAESRYSLLPGSPVYYRQMPVGAVEWVELADNGESVNIGVFIHKKYAKLVKNDSEFYQVSGIKASFGIFSGLDMSTESVKAILDGGIAFKTDNMESEQAIDGKVFSLSESR